MRKRAGAAAAWSRHSWCALWRTTLAAALVLAEMDVALAQDKAVVFRAAEQVNDFLPMSRRDPTKFEGASLAWRRALESARIGLDDLSLVETHDCFTIAELIEYEAMGLAAPGQGARAIGEGWTEKSGRLPVNPSGGLKAKGHPIGATGCILTLKALYELERTQKRYALVTMCIGGGQGIAAIFERA